MKHTENKKNKKNRFNARFVLLLSCALILTVCVTFGLTLSYFGGSSDGYSAEFMLKAGIVIKENVVGTTDKSVTFDSEYMVPGTTLNSTCLMTISSGEDDVVNTAVNGLVRVSFSISGDMSGFLSIDDSNPIYVYMGTTSDDMIDDNKVGRIVKAPDNNYYIVDPLTTAINDTTLLYEVPCKTNNGIVNLVFSVPVIVNNTSTDALGNESEFTNEFVTVDSSKTKEATFTAKFEVIQSEYYSTSTTPDPKDYKHAKEVFDFSVNQNAGE